MLITQLIRITIFHAPSRFKDYQFKIFLIRLNASADDGTKIPTSRRWIRIQIAYAVKTALSIIAVGSKKRHITGNFAEPNHGHTWALKGIFRSFIQDARKSFLIVIRFEINII